MTASKEYDRIISEAEKTLFKVISIDHVVKLEYKEIIVECR